MIQLLSTLYLSFALNNTARTPTSFRLALFALYSQHLRLCFHAVSLHLTLFSISVICFTVLIIYLQQPLNYCQFMFHERSPYLSLHPIRLKLCSLDDMRTRIDQFFCYYQNMSAIFSRLFSLVSPLFPSLAQMFALSTLRLVAIHFSFYLCTFSDFLASLIKWPDLQSLNEPHARFSRLHQPIRYTKCCLLYCLFRLLLSIVTASNTH